MKIKLISAVVALAIVLLPLSLIVLLPHAYAAEVPPAQPLPQGGSQHSEGMQQMRQACAADAKKFCAQVKPGGGRILACLEEHSKEISPECSSVLEKRTQHEKDSPPK